MEHLSGPLEQIPVGVLRGITFALELDVAVAFGHGRLIRIEGVMSRLVEEDMPEWITIMKLMIDCEDEATELQIRIVEHLHVVYLCVSIVKLFNVPWRTNP